MRELITGGLAAGALTVLVCTSKFGEAGRNWLLNWLKKKEAPRLFREYLDSLLCCTFCTSWWLSLAMIDSFSIAEWAATVAIANITVLLIHWAISTIGEDE
jgi:hypothetical protein